MKYTILGFQQKKLIENNLTVEDAFILRTIKDMYASASMEFKTIENEKYMWINYSYLVEQIPIVGEKRNLMRRIEKYGSDLLIVRKLEFSRNNIKGKFSYIKPTEKLDSLEDFDLMTKSHKGYDRIAQGLCENDIRVMTESHIKDTSIKDTSIKDNKININQEVFNYYISKNNLTKHKKLVEPMKKAIALSIKTYDLDLDYLKKIIYRHSEKIEQTKNSEYPVSQRTLQELFGQKKYKSQDLICADYLDEKYISNKKLTVEEIKQQSDKESAEKYGF